MNPSKIDYETVLGRSVKPFIFDEPQLAKLKSEKILVTGAGGSIGSRIIKLLSEVGSTNFLATDRDESALHSLSLEIYDKALFDGPEFELVDIRDSKGLQDCINHYQPTTIIHAAALKHLSVLERQPREALLTNVYGTLNLLEAAKNCNVANFVNISTDKAANPSSVLGKSKFIAELLTASFRRSYSLGYTNVRFGNVFASRGSVIETFISQIQKKQQITLTDKNVTRFFMHKDEAAYLCLKSTLINEGDVHIFEMGEPVLLFDVVQKLQQILQLKSEIKITGLRSGEKLNEELISFGQMTTPSSEKMIAIAQLGELLPNYHEFITKVISRQEDKLICDFLTSVKSN